jgi:hypothetical protein
MSIFEHDHLNSLPMKNIFKTLFAFSFLLISLNSIASKQETVKFKGKIVIADSDLSNVTVNLYKRNEIVNTFVTNASGGFEMKLDLGNNYTFEVIKEGYITKRLAVNATSNKIIKNRVANFDFFCELIPYKDGVDTSELDFPITIIELNEKKGEFEYVASYTKSMAKEQEKVIEQLSLKFDF